MKRILSFLVLSFCMVLSSFGSNSGLGKIILYRENVFQGSGTAYKIYINNSFVIKLKNNSQFEYNCPPGDYSIYAEKLQDSVFNLKVEEGKTYYVRFDMHKGNMGNKVYATLIDNASAKPTTISQSVRNLEARNQPMTSRGKNRFGITVPFGFGFDNHDLFTLDDGGQASVSFGGGFGVGFIYGREFSRYFDLSFDFFYKNSSLTPHIENGGASFSRFFFSATPAVIIPVKGGDRMRFKIGVGPDVYFGNEFELDASDAGGFDETYTYENAFGAHFSVIFEINVSDNFSLNYGLKFYGVSYDYEKSKNRYAPIFHSPNGSGLDFMIGFNFHF